MLQFVKLGGSLITDKTRAYTAREDVIARLAEEVSRALEGAPNLGLLIGHGSGSFGHWAAEPYGTREGVATPAQWRGYAEVAAAAARLNRLVTDSFLRAAVPVLSLQPSASARCRDGELISLDSGPVRLALDEGLVPLVYGDVAFDEVRGGTIASTEEIFTYLAEELTPARILLLGRVPGVLGEDGETVPRISPSSLSRWRDTLSGSGGVDVTGGMADKVARMVDLVQRHPEIEVHILSGTSPGLLTQTLLGATPVAGTVIRA